MKQIVVILLGLISVAHAQFAPTSAKTAFKNGVSLGSKDSTTFAANDSLVVVIDRNGRLMWRGNGTNAVWRVVPFGTDTLIDTRFVRLQKGNMYQEIGKVWVSDTLRSRLLRASKVLTDSVQALGSAGMAFYTNSGTKSFSYGAGGSSEVTFNGFAGYDANRAGSYTARSFTDKNYVDSADGLRKLISDTLFTNGYTTRGTTKKIADSLGAVISAGDNLRVRYTDTATMLNPYVRGTGTNNTIPKFNSTTRTLTNSNIVDNGTTVTVSSNTRINTSGANQNAQIGISPLVTGSITDFSSLGGNIGLSRPEDGNAALNTIFSYNTASNAKNNMAISFRNDLAFVGFQGGTVTERGRIGSTGNWVFGSSPDNGTDRIQVSGNGRFTGDIITNSTTASTTSSTGSIRSAGGLGVAGAGNFGGNLATTDGVSSLSMQLVANGPRLSFIDNRGAGRRYDIGSVAAGAGNFGLFDSNASLLRWIVNSTGKFVVGSSLSDTIANFNVVGNARVTTGLSTQRATVTSLVTNKDSIPITTSNFWALQVDTSGTPGTNRINRRDISAVHTGAVAFDTSSRTLTINQISGGTTSVVIPRGTASGTSGITALSSSRTGNLVTVSGDNGSSTIFSVRDADSSSPLQSLTASYGISGSPYNGNSPQTWLVDTSVISTKANVTAGLVAKLNTSDTASMLIGYQRQGFALLLQDTATMLLPFVQYSDTANQMNGYLRKNFALLLQDTSTAFSVRPLNNRFLDSIASIRALANTRGTVFSVATNSGTGISGGTITSTGTLALDTTLLSTRAWRQKGADSLNGLISARVRFADTATMLTPYLRKSDTTTMLSPYYRTATAASALALKLNIPDTATMLSRYLRKTDTTAMLSNYARLSGANFTGGVNLGSISGNIGISTASNESGWKVDISSLVALGSAQGNGRLYISAEDSTNGATFVQARNLTTATPLRYLASKHNFEDGNVLVKNTTESTSNTSGSLIVSGGIGVAGNVNAGGAVKSSGLIQPISIKSADYTLTANDHTVIFDVSAASRTATLPAGVEGQIFVIKMKGSSSNTVTVTPNGSQTVEGLSSYVVSGCDGTAITIQFLSGNWEIISNNYSTSCF